MNSHSGNNEQFLFQQWFICAEHLMFKLCPNNPLFNFFLWELNRGLFCFMFRISVAKSTVPLKKEDNVI